MSSSAARAGPRLAAAAALSPFDRVVDEHGRAVLRFCMSRSGAAGEDVFQETMIAAMRAYPELREPGAVRGWLFSIAHRKAIDAGRAAQRAPRPGGTAAEVEATGVGARPVADQHVEFWGGDPWAAVRELPRKQREAITLRYLGDLTHAEVASIMETSEDAARRNVFEGLRRLRDVVDRDGGRV